jgi:signal peptidase I
MGWKPNRFVAVLLGLFTQPFAMLYLARVRLAIFYLVIPLVIFSGEFIFSAPWLKHFSFSSVVAVICAIHAYFIAANSMPEIKRPWFSRWHGMLGIFTGFVAAVFSFRAFLYEPFRMPSGSMLPTIKVGSYMIVEKYGYGNYGTYGITVDNTHMTSPIARGDLLVFDYPVDPTIKYIKRVIGVPGDTLVFKNHQLTINGQPVATEADTLDTDNEIQSYGGEEHVYLRETLSNVTYQVAYVKSASDTGFEVVVPPHNYFVLGDNRDNSRDSRYWGFVPQQNIVGKVVYTTN